MRDRLRTIIDVDPKPLNQKSETRRPHNLKFESQILARTLKPKPLVTFSLQQSSAASLN